ncbi:MAG: ferritin-like domain-containing protein [Actinomycetota bacterium]|nr:ferritin-like domain-containing protein [Actinomycetota bacterium]
MQATPIIRHTKGAVLRRPELFHGKPVIAFDTEDSRRNFLRGAALIGVGGTLAITRAGDRFALAQDASQNDLDILNYALTLEYLEAAFYTRALENNVVEGRELELVTPIRDHEQAHVAAVSGTISDLGGEPVERPRFRFPDGVLDNRDAFLETASVFEELGVTAYQGQVTNIENGDILAAAAAIAGVESRHAAIIAQISGGNPFPATMEATATMDEVLEAAMQFIRS